MPQFVFEAHSTDYQSADALSGLVEDGFAILKVGPWLTFALREALYGLDAIAQVLAPAARARRAGRHGTPDAGRARELEEILSRRKRGSPSGSAAFQVQRPRSYYWPHRETRAAVDLLEARLAGRTIPETLVSQDLPWLYPEVVAGRLPAHARDLQLAAVGTLSSKYAAACR